MTSRSPSRPMLIPSPAGRVRAQGGVGHPPFAQAPVIPPPHVGASTDGTSIHTYIAKCSNNREARARIGTDAKLL